MDTITVRAGTYSDIDAALELGTTQELWRTPPSDNRTRDQDMRLCHNRDTLWLVAVAKNAVGHGHTVIGSGSIHRTTTLRGDKARLEDLVVAKTWRGAEHAIAARLLGVLAEHAQSSWKVGALTWSSRPSPDREAARAFYTRMGAKLTEHSNSEWRLDLRNETTPEALQPYMKEWRLARSAATN